MQSTQVMYDQDIKRWGLHHLDPRGGLPSIGTDYSSYDSYTFVSYETPESQFMNQSPAEVDNNFANNETPETSETHKPEVRNISPAEVDNNIPNDETRETSKTPEPQLINLSPAELGNNVPTDEAIVHHNIANDEAIARLLQEELSKLAAEEAEPHHSGQSFDGSSKAAVLSQDWQGSPVSNSSNREISNTSGTTGRESERQADGGAGGYEQSGLTNDSQAFTVDNNDSMGPRKQGSSSSLRSDSRGKTMGSSRDYDAYQYGDDDENLTLALALSEEEHGRDEEVAKRLSKLDSIRHVPRINADVMPTVDVASLDHARLMERLILYGLNERKIQGDGNCQFRALSDQLYHESEHHKFVRKSIVTQLKARPDVYSGYVPMPYDEYLKKMAKSGEWGDHVTLQAAADSYGVKIWLITSFKSTSFIEILPENLMSQRVIYLSFWAEVHYNSIYPEGDTSTSIEFAPKKKHWLLKSIF